MKNINPTAEQYTDICHLIEELWLNRKKKEYYNCPDINNLPALVSPQSRAVANAILQILGR